ncbi:MAG: O-antigen ligase family protein [Amphiplicatus sp.]
MNSFGATVHERAIMAALVFCALFLPLIVPLAHKGVAPMVLLMGLAVASRGEPWRKGVPHFLLHPDFSDPLVRCALAMIAFALWIALAGLWAPRADGPRLGLNVLAPVLAGGALAWETARRPRAQTELLARVLAAGAAAAILLLLFEALTGGALRSLAPPADVSFERTRDWKELGRGATVAVAILFGALLLIERLTKRRAVVAALFAAALVASVMLGIASNAIAIVLGGAVFAAARKRPNATIMTLASVIVAAMAFSLLAALIPAQSIVESGAALPLSWLQRLFIWRESARAALDCLPFGCGPDYARVLKESIEPVIIPGAPAPLSGLPVHPHNLFLQFWLETGLPGVLLFAAFVYNGARALIRAELSHAEKAAVAATAAAMLVSALVEMSVWQVWRLAAPALAGLFIALAVQRREKAAPTKEPAQ